MGGFLVNLKAISGPATNLLFLTNSTTGTQGPPMGENRVTSASKAYFFQYGWGGNVWVSNKKVEECNPKKKKQNKQKQEKLKFLTKFYIYNVLGYAVYILILLDNLAQF